MFKISEPTSKPSLMINYLREVGRLNDGASFGEVALLKNTGRQATIVCSKPTTFATWSRKDYKLTIGQEDRRKLKESVMMLRKYRIFCN